MSANLPPKSPPRSAALIGVGLALAAVAVLLVNVYAQVLVRKNQEDTFTAYQFQTEIGADRPLRPESVTPVQIPEKFRNALGDLITDPKVLEGLTADGKKLRRAAPAGALLTHGYLKSAKEADPRSDPITDGKLALSIKVDNLPASLEAGDFVDLLVNVPASSARSGVRCIPLMEYVRVIAKGEVVVSENGAASRSGQGVSKIDIELTPEQAVQFKNIQRNLGGTPFEVSVRNRGDSKPHGLVPNMTEINPDVFKALGITPYRSGKD